MNEDIVAKLHGLQIFIDDKMQGREQRRSHMKLIIVNTYNCVLCRLDRSVGTGNGNGRLITLITFTGIAVCITHTHTW